MLEACGKAEGKQASRLRANRRRPVRWQVYSALKTSASNSYYSIHSSTNQLHKHYSNGTRNTPRAICAGYISLTNCVVMCNLHTDS